MLGGWAATFLWLKDLQPRQIGADLGTDRQGPGGDMQGEVSAHRPPPALPAWLPPSVHVIALPGPPAATNSSPSFIDTGSF